MKMTVPASDLSRKPTFPRKPPRRKIAAGVRLKRSSRPETPLLRWKFDEANYNPAAEEKPSGEAGRKSRAAVVSARKVGAELWRLHSPEFYTNGAGKRLGLQSENGHFKTPIHSHHVDRIHTSSTKDVVHKNPLLYKFEPSFQFASSAMEVATKWDPVDLKASDKPKQLNQRTKAALEAELEHARAKINDLETERKSSKKKLEQFLRKLSEERAAWRINEHEKVRAVMDDIKTDINREKKKCQRLETINSKLANDLADAKFTAKRYLQEYEKERKARELVEDVCDELAKEMGEDKAEVDELKRESNKVWEEVGEERKMLQMAEVWREERVQMKLVDVKVMLEEKYSQMNGIIAELESFLNSRNGNSDETEKAEFLRQVAGSVDIRDVREMTYVPPNPDEIFSVFEGDDNSKIHTVSPEVKLEGRSGELEEDDSEWETVSHGGSSCRASPIVGISEVGPVLKKVSSISRLWRSSYHSSSGRVSTGVMVSSLDCGLEKVEYNRKDSGGEWSSSPDYGNPRVNRGGVKGGCIEWPRGTHKSSLKAKMDTQKIQLRQVLKHKI